MKTLALVAFQFPPLVGTSGIQRTLRFVQHLPSFGWRPVVITPWRGIHRTVDLETEKALPPECEVIRTGCLDTARHLAIGGRYLGGMALPDRWTSWRWFAPLALKQLRALDPQVVWSTYPIATAHHVGHDLSKRLGVPWVADFRDPMAQDGYPSDPRQHRAFVETERLAIEHARKLVFVAPSALETYRKRYASTQAERFELIENGFDENAFDGLRRDPPPRDGRPLVLLHSGMVYENERNPSALFESISRLHRKGTLQPSDVTIRFRAPVQEAFVRERAEHFGVTDFVEILPRFTYREALAEMLSVDALLVLQSETCNEQIPAKLYEYLRTEQPILALTDPAGDTGKLLQSLDLPWVTPLEKTDPVEEMLPRFLSQLREGQISSADPAAVARYSRKALTGRLVEVLDGLDAPSP
ncbi:MAG: glycosyltransferase [Pseudomonadota bacterium]